MSQPAQVPFLNLRGPESTARLAEWDDSVDLEQVTCPVNSGHRRAGKRITDLSILLRGRGVEDFVWTWFSECLVQDRVVDLFRAHGITGFDVRPARARFKKRPAEPAPRLWELVVTGWAGMAPPESGIALVERCPACRMTRYSGCSNPAVLINARQWDRSDMFIVWPLPRFIFVTARVADLVRRTGLTGAQIRAVDGLHLSGPLGPGLLSHWVPAALALGRSAELGID